MAISSNPQKAPVGTRVTILTNFTSASPAYVTSIGININLVHAHIAFPICCRSTELIRITYKLLRKDLYKIAIMGSHITIKSCFGQTPPISDVTNMFWMKSVRNRSQVLFPKLFVSRWECLLRPAYGRKQIGLHLHPRKITSGYVRNDEALFRL